jgi:hypothetical protein
LKWFIGNRLRARSRDACAPARRPRAVADGARSSDLSRRHDRFKEERETMEAVAIVTFVIIAGIVWGGALLIASTAIRKESGKAKGN